MLYKQPFASTLFHLRQRISEKLPIGNSLLSLDILIVVMMESSDSEALTVKRLFATLPYSSTGVRYHFERLLNDGWLELDDGINDKRIKIVKPSPKLIDTFQRLSGELQPITLKNCDDCPLLTPIT